MTDYATWRRDKMATEPQVPGSITQSADVGIPAASQAQTGVKIVGEGDIQEQLVSWSNEFNTDPLTILKENNIKNSSDIRPGMMMDIPSGLHGGAAADTSEEDTLLSQLTDLVKTSWSDITGGDQPTEDYSAGKFTAPGVDVSLEGKGDLDTKPRDFFGETVTETEYGTSKVDLTAGSGEGLISEATELPGGVTKAVPGEDALALAPPPEEVEVKPSITGTEVPAVSEGTVTTPVSTEITPKVTTETAQAPTESELVKLIESLRPVSKPAADVFDGVIENIQEIEHESTFDAKEFYREISEEAERETKKIDDSIAEIAEEKIKPTFSGWNKFMAVLGAAMGAYGSAMTGTPNYALQIMNNAIDADQEQFLASKEIRTKSLLQQRLAVIQRKADLLQMGINEADRMLQVAELQIKKEESIASVRAIKEGLVQAKDKEINDFKMKVIEILSEKAAARKISDLAQSKDFRERGVKPVTLKNGQGETVTIPGYAASTVGEAEKSREIRAGAKKINNLLDDMENLYKNESNWLPGVIDESTAQLNQKYNQLLLVVKNVNKMGANFTLPEIEMIKAVIPTADIAGKLSTGLVKISALRDQYISDEYAVMESFGYTQMPNAANKKKLAKGQKIGVSK